MARCVISKDGATISTKIWDTYTCGMAVNTRLHYVNGVHIIKYTTLHPHFIIIRPMHKCEIQTQQSNFSICWTKVCAGDRTFH